MKLSDLFEEYGEIRRPNPMSASDKMMHRARLKQIQALGPLNTQSAPDREKREGFLAGLKNSTDIDDEVSGIDTNPGDPQEDERDLLDFLSRDDI